VLGEYMRAELMRRPLTADLVVPVPLAPSRLRERGYNQALLLAEEVAVAVQGRLAPYALERADRPPQMTLSAIERRTNLQDAVHCVSPDQILGQRILLIDDVATTTATLSACADALAKCGARRVAALVFARDL
jgi:ComF family protein